VYNIIIIIIIIIMIIFVVSVTVILIAPLYLSDTSVGARFVW